MVWGGRRLGEVLGKILPEEHAYGEAWEISDHGSHHSVVAGGPWHGRSLRQLMEQERPALLGPHAADHRIFPWLVKYLDARDWLSVQVHPGDELVAELWPGEGGKTEAWFVLDAEPDSCIYAGLLPGVDRARFRRALEAGRAQNCLHQLRPRPGDCLFLPAGTVHAVGGGVLLAEVQQTSDATFRLFDWNRRDAQGRSRTLHIEQGLACTDWQRGPVQPIRPAGYPDRAGAAHPAEPLRQTLVECPYFALEYVRNTRPFALGGTGRLQAVLVLHGRGQLHGPGTEQTLTAGETLLLPASLPVWQCQPDGPIGLLLATL